MESKKFTNQTNYIQNVFVSKINILEGGHQLRHSGTTLGQADTFH